MNNTLDTITAEKALTKLREWLGTDGTLYREVVEILRPSAVEAAPKVCGTCLGRGRRDIAHGESVPSPPCNGTGIVPAPASTPAAAPGAGDGKWVPLEPTREMRAAGDSVVLRSGYRASDVFRAMVQEAPSMSCQTVIPGAPYIAISRTSKSPRPDLVRRLPALTHGIDLQKEAREARGIASAWKSKGDVGHAACMFHVACVFDSLAAAPTSEAHGCECDPAQNYVCDDCEGDAAPTSAPTPDRATPGERDALSALRKLAAKAAPGPYEYDSEHCTIVGNGHCPDCDDGCRHVHVDIEPSDLAFIIAAANYVSASLPQARWPAACWLHRHKRGLNP